MRQQNLAVKLPSFVSINHDVALHDPCCSFAPTVWNVMERMRPRTWPSTQGVILSRCLSVMRVVSQMAFVRTGFKDTENSLQEMLF